MKKVILFITFVLLLIPFVLADGLYDDFSNGMLDTSKWQEVISGGGMIDEHFVNRTEGMYHTAQLTPSDRGVKLKLLRHIFVPGETIEFDVEYRSGSGNQIHFIDANDNNIRGIALFGTWNGIQFCTGDSFGEYHIKTFFTQQGVDVEVRKPNNTTVLCKQFGEIQPANQYRFSVVTRTGHNGVTHIDYDNFYIRSSTSRVKTENLGGGSSPQMCRLSGNPFDIEFTFEPNENFYRAGNASNTTVVGNLTFTAKNLQGTNYALRYTVDEQDRNKTLTYGFEEFGFAPLFKFGVLHVDLASPLAFDATSASPRVTVPITKELLEKTLYLQAIAFNTQELVLSDGHKVTLPKGSDQPQKPPVAQWNFDEGNRTATRDASGNGNHGNLLGNILWTNDSRSGYALDFDGVDDKISVMRTPSVDITNAITIEAWIKQKFGQHTNGTILAKNGPYYLGIQGNKLAGAVYADSGSGNSWQYTYGNTRLQDNVWYKVKMIYDGSFVKIYVNDAVDGSEAKTGKMPVVSQQVWIGWGEPGVDQHFKGIIDDLAIYDYAKQ